MVTFLWLIKRVYFFLTHPVVLTLIFTCLNLNSPPLNCAKFRALLLLEQVEQNLAVILRTIVGLPHFNYFHYFKLICFTLNIPKVKSIHRTLNNDSMKLIGRLVQRSVNELYFLNQCTSWFISVLFHP